MSTYKNIVTQLENLISTASKANTEAISETTKFISQIDRSKLNMETLREMEQKLISETLISVAKLNVKYITDLIQLSVSLTKRLNENTRETTATEDAPPPKSSVSAFEIKTSATAGETATTAFLLNSDKNEPIVCEVTNTAFYAVTDPTVSFDTPVTYSPQAFDLIKGIAQRVDVSIPVPANIASGTYTSKISVKGFEHVHFDLHLLVSAPLAKDKGTVVPAKTSAGKATPKGNTKKKVAKKASPAKKTKK